MKPWKTLSRRTVLALPPFLTVEVHEVETSGGRVIPDWAWIITPDYVTVLAETVEGRFLCFCQSKYAVEGVSLALVGGFIDVGEAPESAARRELLEETGYAASDWRPLGAFAVDANRGAGRAHVFMARRAQCVAEAVGGDLEEQELILLTRSEIASALDAGEFKVLPWATAVALGLRHIPDGG